MKPAIGWTKALATAALVLLSTGKGLAQNASGIVAVRNGAASLSLLERRAYLDVEHLELGAALQLIYHRAGVPLLFSPSLLPKGHRITCKCATATVADALDRMLDGTGLRYVELSGQIVIEAAPPVRAPFAQREIAMPSPALVDIERVFDTFVSKYELVRLRATLTGRVTSGGQPIEAADVQVVGTQLRALSDADGRYTIANVPAGTHTIRVTRLGYKTLSQNVTVPASGTVTLDFDVETAAIGLDQVVVTVTGEQRRLEIGNVIGTIQAEGLTAVAPITNLANLLEARVPGAQIISLDGMTGTSPDIRIRGMNSLSVSNAPLFVVDGVRVNNQSTIGSSSTDVRAGFGQWGGRLNDLNPQEIESIEIVKGPSAATLYGTDAANGVVVIRTKRGRAGPPAWMTYAEVGTLRPAERFLDNYYSWGTSPQGVVRQCRLIDSVTGLCAIDSLTTFNPLHDAESSPLGTGLRHQLGAQVRGGVDRFTYFFSGEHERETGYFRLPTSEQERLMEERGATSLPDDQIRPNWLERLSLRANTGANFGAADLTLTNGLVIGEAQIPSPGSITSPGEFGQGYNNDATFGGWRDGRRPGETFSVRNTEDYTHYTGSLSANVRPTTWLTTRGVVGIDLSNSALDALQRNSEGPPGIGREGRRQNTRSTTTLHSIDLGASAVFPVSPSLSSRTSIGVQYNKRADQITSVNASLLPPGSESIRGASTLTGLELNNQTIVAGTYFEQVLGFNDRLFVTGAVRLDGGSSFGQEFKTAVYPKAGVSWLGLDRGMDGLLNSVRVRGAYGASGVQPGATAALTLYEIFTAFVGGANRAAARPSTIGNPDLRPERQTEFEAGIDLTLMSGRITFEGTYYNRLSTDALISRPLSPDVGVASRWENIGSVRNSGVEGLLSVQAVATAQFGLDITLNASHNNNTLEQLGIDLPSFGPATYQHHEGFPLFGRWARPILSYGDANSNGIIEPAEVQYGDTAVFLGPSIAPTTFSFSASVNLFNNLLRISSLFDRRSGMAGLNVNEINRCSALLSNCRAVNDPSTPLAEQARTVSFLHTNFGGTWAGFMEDGSFTRWRELSISVDIPQRYLRWLNASNAVLALSGRNIALFTDYSGKDPEISSSPGNPLTEGYSDNPTVPQTRYWILRLTLGM
jgi:TonB-linked SusC/RagA family outer membrane protein